jgi:hypothetical protein
MHLPSVFLALGAVTPILGAISLGKHDGKQDGKRQQDSCRWMAAVQGFLLTPKTVAWLSGESPCAGESVGTINDNGGNPCEAGEFKVKGQWYRLEGCGGTDFKVVRTHPGGWEGHCVSKQWKCTTYRLGNFYQDWQCG